MTWKQFALTGTVEDYLRYKGIDFQTNDLAAVSLEETVKNRREKNNGTVDYIDRHGAGGVSVR